MHAPYACRVSFEARDPDWDAFVRESPEGHYMQSSLWAEFKRAFRWSPARVVLSRNGEIVGGAQVLLRRVPILGNVAWAPKAPVLGEADAALRDRALDELLALLKRSRARVLLLQPPRADPTLLGALRRRGFRPSPIGMAPTATILIDLDADLDTILSNMRRKTRQHIRKGERAGVTVREGDEADLVTFYRLHLATGERQHFSPYPLSHFTTLWRTLRPSGSVRLFLADYREEPLSGLVLLTHGDTVHTHAMGWSGTHPECMSNEVLYWSAIAWSRNHGYRWWDFTWIDHRGGEAVARGDPLPEDLQRSVTFFKLGFGGDVTLFPGGYDYVDDRVLRTVFHLVVPQLYRLRSVRKAQRRLRWRWLPSLRRQSREPAATGPAGVPGQ
jgi:lipid II:glycine glycyltransferase (peptidoglycan interpeptide bridge formation enzyme)